MSKSTDRIESPDYLAMPTHGKGVKRLNNVPRNIGIGLSLFITGLIVYGGINRFSEPEERLREAEKPQKLETFAVPAVSRPDGPDVMLPPAPPPEVFSNPPPREAPMTDQQVPEHVRKRIAAYDAALASDIRVTDFSATETAKPEAPPPFVASARERERDISQPRDPNMQQEKQDFLSSFDESGSPYLKHTRMAPVSATEIKAGSIIPGIMISGVKSDLPGQLIGQVSQTVYDSATGRIPLIPAGAKVIGPYDSQVAMGQENILTAWTRIIFPDGSSVSLDGMPGADKSGFAGFHEKVNNHYWRTFGNAFMLSLFSAGIQLSQPRAAVQGTYSSQQVMAAALGQQLGQLGMQVARKNLNIQPTLETSPGFKFSIMVTKDIILPPWTGHPLAQARN